MRVSESFKQTVLEVFNAPYEYFDMPGRKDQFIFETEDGIEYKVVFFDREEETEVSFAARTQDDPLNWTDDVLGKGNAFRVFSTVMDIAKKFVAEHNISRLMFRAKSKEDNRVRLYRTMLNKFKPVGFRLSEETPEGKSYHIFRLTKE